MTIQIKFKETVNCRLNLTFSFQLSGAVSFPTPGLKIWFSYPNTNNTIRVLNLTDLIICVTFHHLASKAIIAKLWKISAAENETIPIKSTRVYSHKDKVQQLQQLVLCSNKIR